MYTNRTRMVGLSGIDTDTLVKQLMQAESVKYNNLKKQNTKLKWQQEKYRDVASSLKAFQDSFLDILSPTSMRANATFGGYTASAKITGADTSKVTVKTTKDTKEGSYKLKVSQLAQKSSVASSTEMTYGGKIISAEGFSVKELTAGDTIKFSLDGVTKTIEITSDFLTDAGTSSDGEVFASKLGEALDAAYGKSTGTFVASTTGTGTSKKLTIKMTEGGHDLKIVNGTREKPTSYSSTGLTSDFKLSAGKYNFEIGGNTVSITLEENSDKNQIVKKINEAIDNDEAVKSLGVRASVNGNEIVFSSSNASNDITLKAGSNTGDSSDLLAAINFGSNFDRKLENTSVLSDLGIMNNASTLGATSMKLSELYVLNGDNAPDENGNFVFNIAGVEGGGITVHKDDTLQALINKINSSTAGVNVKYDSITKKFTMEAKSEGELNGFKTTDITQDLKDFFGFTGSVTEAKDAKFNINGVDSSRATNTFTIDGLTITLNEKTARGETVDEDEVITIDVKKDSSKAMDAIKGFVSAYNELIAKINGEVDATRAKNGKYSYYEPLTDDERNAMSESEVKLWEEKAKQGILGRDTILSGITRDMRTAMYQKVEISDGKYLSLYDIGITTTSSYWEGGKLAIDEKKLSAALEEYGDDVAKLFTTTDTSIKGHTSEKLGIGSRMLNIVDSAIGSKGTITQKAGIESRAMSLTTNDMYNQIKRQEDKISDMLSRLIEKEEYYYSMFSRMEAAVMQANSQMEYLAAQLG